MAVRPPPDDDCLQQSEFPAQRRKKKNQCADDFIKIQVKKLKTESDRRSGRRSKDLRPFSLIFRYLMEPWKMLQVCIKRQFLNKSARQSLKKCTEPTPSKTFHSWNLTNLIHAHQQLFSHQCERLGKVQTHTAAPEKPHGANNNPARLLPVNKLPD